MNSLITCIVIIVFLLGLTSKAWLPAVRIRHETRAFLKSYEKALSKKNKKIQKKLERQQKQVQGTTHVAANISPVQPKMQTFHPQDSSLPMEPDEQMVRMVAANDRGEEWAQREMQELWNRYSDTDLRPLLSKARLRIYDEAAQRGDPDAQYYVGMACFDINCPNEGRALLEGLANIGDVRAMTAMAMQYTPFGYYGENSQEYLKWELRAAKAGDVAAMCAVGLEYLCNEDEDSALLWYEKAAKQGDPEGCIGTAKIYFNRALWLYGDVLNQSAPPETRQTLKEEALQKRLKSADLLEQAVEVGISVRQMTEALPILAQLYSDRELPLFDPNEAYYYFYMAGLAYQRETGEFPSHLQDIMDKLQAENDLQVTAADLRQWEEDFRESFGS